MMDTRRKPKSWSRTTSDGIVTYSVWCHRKRCTQKIVMDVDGITVNDLYYPYYTIIVQLDDDTSYAFCSAHCASLFLSAYTRE